MAVEVNNKSYAKLMLHLVKHPHAPVSGYLIGTISESDEVSVEDIIPLFHTHILTPMLEVATNLIENSDNKIIGFYHVNERVDDRGIPIVVEAIATKVESNCPNSILLQVLNDKLVDPNEHALQAWAITKNGTWNRALEIQQSPAFKEGMLLASKAVEAKLYEKISDFDDHFEDVSKSPFNEEINQALTSL